MTSSTLLARPEEINSNALSSREKVSVDTLLLTDKPLSELVFTNCNSLASAATPLLLLLSQIKTMEAPDNVAEFHWKVRQSIEKYELQAQKNHCEPRIILATRYCLCTAIDEMILCTTWGGQSLWPEQTLLSLIHKETWGGERFFDILEKMTQEGEKNIDFLEVIFMVLSFGYEGKYYKQERIVKEEICHHLFRIIETYRKRQAKDLFPKKSLARKEEKKHRLDSKTRWIVLLTLCAMAILWLSFNVLTYRAAKITLTELYQLGNQGTSTDFQQSPQGQAKWTGDFYDTNN